MARTVTENRPVTVGVPKTTPVEVNVIPAGRMPAATANVTGPFPPVVFSVASCKKSPAITEGGVTESMRSVANVLTVTGGVKPEQPAALQACTRYR